MVLSCLLQMEPYSSLLADSEDIHNELWFLFAIGKEEMFSL